MQGIYSVIAVFTLVGAGAFFLHGELQAIGTWFVSTFGLLGVFVGVMLTDSVGIPIPPDTYLFAAVTAHMEPVSLLTVTSVTSIVGGNLAYLIGTKLHRWPFLKRRMDLFRVRGEALMSRWGVWAVAIAAWTPVPFSVVCWFAGAYEMNYRRFFFATLHRAPRIVVYYYVIVLGWHAGTVIPT